MILDGTLVKSCMLLAVQADGASIETVEGLAEEEQLTPLQQAFSDHHALQCGYCTPGMLMSATALLRDNPSPSDEEIAKAIQGNICRCTGYWNIVKAVKAASGPGGGRVSETTTVAEPIVVEQTETKPGYAGQNVPRKEDKRLVQGEGVFFDDVKRHNMGYVHFVRSPYAHAKIRSVDVSKALEHPGVLGTLTGRRGRAADRSVLPDLLPAGRAPEGLLPRGRQGPLRRRAGRRGRGDHARDRPRRLGAGRGRLRAAAGR